MKRIRFTLLTLMLGMVLAGCGEPGLLYQTSCIDALLAGDYDGQMTLGRLKTHGNLGLGTFDALDGEMVLLDGVVYQVRADGKAHTPPDSMTTPFAAVVAFAPETTVPVQTTADLTMQEVRAVLDEGLGGLNVPYAMRMTGTFKFMKTRSVPRQTKPYRPLVEVVKNQPEFTFQNVTGTIVVIRCPSYVKGLNVPGWHMHFITADRVAGGHVLDFRVGCATTEIDRLDAIRADLPTGRAFRELDLTGDRRQELHKVER